MLKARLHLLYLFLTTLLFCLLYTQFLSHTPFFISARLKSVDVLYSWRSQHAKPLSALSEVVVIGVDDASYQQMNRAWPWGRDVFAALLENLRKLNPKVIGLDFSLIGASSNAATDQWLAEAIAKNGNVIIANYFDVRDYYIVPLEIFRKAAAGHGFVDKTLDRDAVVRRAKTLVKLKDTREPVFSFSSLVAYTYLGLSPSEGIEVNEESILFSKLRVPADEKDQLWLSFRYKPRDFTYIPFWKVIAGEAPREAIEGKIVLVGVVSPIFHDMHITPLGVMPGIYIVAAETLMILDKDFIRELIPKRQWLLFITLITLFTFVYYRRPFRTSLLILIGTELLIYVTALYLFRYKNLIFEPFSAMFISVMVYFVVMGYMSLRTVIENVKLQRMVITDSLTGLYVHRYLTLRLATEFDRFREAHAEFCVAMIDVDLFKKVNDVYGHEKGNEVLIRIATSLKNGLRGTDVLARYGGEEFSVIGLGLTENTAYQVIERIRAAIQQEVFSSPNGNFQVTISAGICSNLNPDVTSAAGMIRLADDALYQAKSEGRNRIQIYRSKNREVQ